jgi:hypothetical protein
MENKMKRGNKMELIDKNKITFEPIEIYNCDEHKHEITGMALFKDVEKIPIIKAIPIDKVKQARNEIENLASWDECCVEVYDVLETLDKLIESEEQ